MLKNEFFRGLISFNTGDSVPFLYGNVKRYRYINNKTYPIYQTESLMYIIPLDNGKYEFSTDIEASQLRQIVRKVCQEKGWCKWQVLTDANIKLTLKQTMELYDAMPNYFTEFSGGNYVAKELSFDIDEMIASAKEYNTEFEIARLKDEISKIKRDYEKLPELESYYAELCKKKTTNEVK